ncbi:MAG: hypothetical protein M0Z54_10405 [Thermaerobacter sp.]|nr:hypothetical protein [Thermaerobacter sp.]
MPTANILSALTRITGLLVTVAGGLFTLVMVYGGIRFMTASSPRSVEGAKSVMARAALGLLLILMVDVVKNLLTFIAK